MTQTPVRRCFLSFRPGRMPRLAAPKLWGLCLGALCLGVGLGVLLLAPGPAQAHPLPSAAAQTAPVVEVTPEPIAPVLAPVQLDLGAVISGTTVIYTIYATNITDHPLWDVTLQLPLPEGAMLLSAQASSRFVVDFDKGVVSFYVPDLDPNVKSGPQRVQIVVPGGEDSFATTHVEASWKYLDSIMRQSSAFLARAETSAASMVPGTSRQVVADMVGEVPLDHVDLTGVMIQQEGSLYRLDLQLAGPLGPPGETAEYTVYIDSDCNPATGRSREALGAEHRLGYRHDRGRADLSTWTVAPDNRGQWLLAGSIGVNSPAGSQTISLWIPAVLLDNSRQFCWLAESEQRTPADAPKLPKDRLPNGAVDPAFTRFGNWEEVSAAQSNRFVVSAPPQDPTVGAATLAQQMLQASIPAAETPITGKLAIPFSNAQGGYDIYLFSMPDGLLLQQIPNAQQPALRSDGVHLVAARASGAADGATSLLEYDLGGEIELPGRATEASAYPSYSLQGSQLVYESWQSPPAEPAGLVQTAGELAGVTLALCDAGVSAQAGGSTCANASSLQTLLSLDALAAIHGTHPLWAANGQVIYRSCPAWNGLERCGIYSTQIATGSAGQPSFPTLLTYQPWAFPNDTKDGYLALTGRQGEDWEVYALSLDGSWMVNVSRNASAQDGLAAISPDAHWIAFVSNRGGKWAVWAASLPGGSAQKLFDLPSSGAWATDEQEWVRQRIAWGQ